MKQKTLKTLLVCLLAFAGMNKSYAHDIEVANADGVTIYYNFTNDQTELAVAYQGSDKFSRTYAGKVVIPESVSYEGNTYSVTSIGDYVFCYCHSLTEVTIPSTVTSIGDYAFQGCDGLTEVTIPNSVTSIGIQAFYSCSGLTEVTIPNSITSIGDYAFDGCSGLTEVTIPGSITSIGIQAFSGCRGLIKVTICDGVTSIGTGAFSHCSSLTSVTIPNSVTSIGNTAFYFCSSLTEVTIPNSVTSIGDGAFWLCSSLTSVTIPNSVTSIDIGLFRDCDSLEKITVESGNPNYDSREDCNAIIETSSNELIAGCKNTIIPNGVTSIGEFAFHSCRNLPKVTIPNSVTSIGRYAFYNCTSLTELTIGNSVTSIGDMAFNYCIGLTTLHSLNTTPPSVANTDVFDGLYETVDLFVPAEALEAYQSADVWKEFLKLQGFDDGTTTAMEQVQVNADTEAVTVYNLNGQRVEQPRSGLYIKNGKKVVIK